LPEGHTLHRLAGALQAEFAGHRPEVTSPQGRFADGAALLSGQLVLSAEAHGKHLFTWFDQDLVWHVHLGLIGKFDLLPVGSPGRGGTPRARIAVPETVGELRGPQTCRVVTPAEVEAVMSTLGPDPLRADADPTRAWARIHRSTRPLAALLMDQSVLSGIGNVYRAEVLFRNRLDPFRPGTGVKRRSWNAIWSDLSELMPIGVETGRIDTVREEHTPEQMGRPPRVDQHGGQVYVYRRAGEACFVCGSRIRTRLLEGRNLFWCGRCQRRS
jgi:formamidopyrimidine-DNA glycosylase